MVESGGAAAQVRISVDFDASLRRAQEQAGTPVRLVGTGIAAQVGLAAHPAGLLASA